MDSLQKALSSKGFDTLQIQTILETVSDSLKIDKEMAVFNPETQKLQLLSETTLDYTLPANEIRYFERVIGDWVEMS